MHTSLPLPFAFSRSMLALTAALLVGLVPASHSLAQPAAAFAASVNGEAQPAERGQLLLQEQVARGVANTPQLQSVLRETLINQAVMAQAAVKAGLDQQPQVRARLDLARQNALAQAWQQQVLQGVQPSDADMQAEYQRQVQALGTQEVLLRHVLVADEKQAQEVHAQLKGGAPFAQVATQFSIDAYTRASGGLSDWVPLGRLAPAVTRALQGLEKGQLAAAPVETGAGWQVLRLEEKRPFTAPALAQVKPQLNQALARQTLQAHLKTLRESANVE
ncbi:MAG: Peptidylprolyl isomerase [Polaromonas sp.]|jgi:peptidyl-prolyl cis-trans isomerase C|nr:Peptidylprolyl isomerase [Polaromonas sp.]